MSEGPLWMPLNWDTSIQLSNSAWCRDKPLRAPTGRQSTEHPAPAGPLQYEEYHPFGTVAWRGERANYSTTYGAKRYRYTGMERDDETGMQYHSARYYLPWLGRWASSDPIGLKGGMNRYAYVGNDPIRFVDRQGKKRTWGEWLGSRARAVGGGLYDATVGNAAKALEPLATNLVRGAQEVATNPVNAAVTLASLTPAGKVASGDLAGAGGDVLNQALAPAKFVGSAAYGAGGTIGLAVATPFTGPGEAAVFLSGDEAAARGAVKRQTENSLAAIEVAVDVAALGTASSGKALLKEAVEAGATSAAKATDEVVSAAAKAVDEAPGTTKLEADAPGVASKGPVRSFSAKEQAIADYIEQVTGLKVTPNPMEGVAGAGRQGDAFIAGVKHEFKTLDVGATSNTIRNTIRRSKARGGQARDWVLDARGTGLSLDEARRGIFRASGAYPDKIDNISVIGDNYFYVGGPRR